MWLLRSGWNRQCGLLCVIGSALLHWGGMRFRAETAPIEFHAKNKSDTPGLIRVTAPLWAATNVTKEKLSINQDIQQNSYIAGASAGLSVYPPWVPASAPRFLVQGGLHGDEISTVRAVRWMAERYQRGQSALNQLDPWGVTIDFLPSANPSGLARLTRTNKNGVNLNRNFPVLWGLTSEYPGTEPFSESETQKIRDLVTSQRYLAAVDLHGYVPWIVAPTSPELMVERARQGGTGSVIMTPERIERHRELMAALQRESVALGSVYSVQTAGALGDGGAFEDWAFWEMGVDAFCLELREPLSQDRELPIHPQGPETDVLSSEDEQILANYEGTIARMFLVSLDLQKKKMPLSVRRGVGKEKIKYN